MQPLISDTSTNHLVAKRYVWECTTAGTSSASIPVWSASYTVDSSTITDGTVTWTCRAPGYSSGSTVDWTFAGLFVAYVAPLLAAGDTVLVHYTSQEPSNSLASASISVTVSGCQIISVDKDASEAYTPMGTSGFLFNSSSATVSINGTTTLKLDGLTLRNTTAGTATLGVGNVNNSQIVGHDLHLELTGNNASPLILLGGGADQRSFCSFTNLTISRANASQKIRLAGFGEINGLTFAGSGVATELFRPSTATDSSGVYWRIDSMDASSGSISSTATLVAESGSVVPAFVEFYNSILPSSYTVLTGATNVSRAGTAVVLTNCKAGSTVGIHSYSDALGTAVRNDAITYNGESFSWKIDASSLATRACPFVLPWMWGEIATGASVTPKIEILRDGSATALTDAEVWCERGAAVTAGSPIKTFVSTEGAYTSSGTNIPTGAGLGSWAGESGTAWSGKLAPAACTPEGDELQMRICSATTTTFYAAQGWDT
jgi:hypothetical protein